ncbi:hypothetical protein M1771_09160 [Spiroplasma citri]|uniref:Transmembrane protein n=2 Tax=Spiroplasma TaxID=2132 RepID=A0A345DRL5_9MOLU|nr:MULTISPECIES: hypothetical protein [Spiroplasma]AXF95751.1 hypothetical protein SDAV_00766 [Spiroplasma phoeniceum P40]AXF95955.1 hypothetical protein SDAV_00975 [Spiroplasma phoeniceum P40]AXF96448.1 hypothetical protein SDAV_001481 [Spiroplasma phoeniceum P40]AXF96856.1 hypothetical protein SDAV_001914 [Spiroplasma phoeniceum P40]WFG96243.1 hypothetical protein M0C40_09225 [Spiroplasma citri]
MNISTDTLMIVLLVLAGSVGTGSLGVLGLSAKKIKKYKAEIRELRTAVIAHEKHLRGAESATELAIKTGQIKNVKKQVKINDKEYAKKEAIEKLTNSI